jgi:MSHA biogenesis protein MshJ
VKRYWDQIATKYDVLQKRERVMVLAAALMLVAAVLNALLLDPLAARRKMLHQQMSSDAQQVQQMQQQIRDMVHAGGIDPDAATKSRLAETQEKLHAVDVQLGSLRQALVSPEKMPQLLEGMLRKHGGLKLAKLNTLPLSALPGSTDVNGGIPAFRHGVELTVEGRYLDLLNYLATLEKLPWHLTWGKVALNARENGLSTLTLTVYTLSMDKTWLSL